MFLKAARHADLDTMRGISANVMCGQEGLFGTNSFQVFLDVEEMQNRASTSNYKPPVVVAEEIARFFEESSSGDMPDHCSKIAIQNNVVSIKTTDMGKDNNYNPGF